MSSPDRRPSMVEWAIVEYQRQFFTQEHKDLIYEINLVCKEMRTIGHTLPCPEVGRGLTVALSSWADILSKKSPLIQAIISCHAETYEVCRRVNRLVEYTTSQYASRGNGTTSPIYPDIVIITHDNTRTLLHLLELLLDQMAFKTR